MPPRWIKMVLWDMDYTLLSTHTGGKWKKSIGELSRQVTRSFRLLVPHLIQRGYSVGVVTFSDSLVLDGSSAGMAGQGLVRDLLIDTFTRLYGQIKSLGSDAKELARRNAEHIQKQVYVAAAYPTLRNKKDPEFKGGSAVKMPNSKAWHIQKVINDYKSRTGKSLKCSEIMLFDDTIGNIEAALETGVHAFAVPAKRCFTSACWEAALTALKSPDAMLGKLRKSRRAQS